MPTAKPDPNRVKIRIAFSGNSRECNIDLDSLSSCKTSINGPLYPDDVILLCEIMKLVNAASTTYPPAAP